ncbi:MAG: hypothetical protein K2X39_04255, partial [Silvanigrellaceae bacterium]|nr:hypothetical protein [Silvanigrellaceae bacterium]
MKNKKKNLSFQNSLPFKQTDSLAYRSLGSILGTLLSRASGVVRTMIINATFGAGLFLDCFNAAFRFPNALRDLLADGALSSAFVKVYVDSLEYSVERQKELTGIILGFFLFVTLSLCCIAAYFSNEIMAYLATPLFQEMGGVEISSSLFKVLVFFLPFTMVNALFMAILGVRGQTFRAMNGSIFLSIGMIFGALVFAPFLHSTQGFLHIHGLVVGTMIGVIFQMLYQMYPLTKLGLLSLPNFNVFKWRRSSALRQVLKLMFPRFIGQGALTLALAINTYFAISIGSGVLTYIVTAVTIIQVPIGLFGVATGFAAQPELTKAINKKEQNVFSKLLTGSLESSIWLALITSGGFALFIVPLYCLIFQHGKITYS